MSISYLSEILENTVNKGLFIKVLWVKALLKGKYSDHFV